MANPLNPCSQYRWFGKVLVHSWGEWVAWTPGGAWAQAPYTVVEETRTCFRCQKQEYRKMKLKGRINAE